VPLRPHASVIAALLAAGCGGGPGTPGDPDADPTMIPDGAGGADAAGDVRGGPVRLNDHSLEDDHGRFNALGATMFWAAWGYRHDRPRLDAALAYLAANGFHYIRALGVVGDPDGPDSWDGREIDDAWPDYDAVIAGLTDLAWDQHGLRVEWTLIGDGDVSVPSDAERHALADRFLAMAETRREKIIMFEIANESYQNGFSGDDGVAKLRELTIYLRDRTDILVAASAPYSQDCGDVVDVYGGGIADLATIHFDRTNNDVEGNWRPMRMPWTYEDCTEPLPVGSNNEPVGPGSSVTSVNDVPPLVAAPLVTWVSGLPLHVFHSRAGVRGEDGFAFSDMAGADAQGHLMALAPGDLASWSRHDCTDPEAPFRCFARDGGTWIADAMWPGLADPTGGAVRVYSASAGSEFFTVAIGIRDQLQLEARRGLAVEVIDPQTGDTVSGETVFAGGATFTVGDGREVLILRGRYQ
jgi:hypothetical protein